MTTDVEARTQEIGRELLRGARKNRPPIWSLSWWDDRAMALSMRDERVKAQLFRFVDVLPTLTDDADINAHLRDYLQPAASRLPRGTRWIVGRIGDWPWSSLASAAARFGARRLAHRFIAGVTVSEVVEAIRRLRREPCAATVDLLGEAVLSDEEADTYQRSYLDLIAGLCDLAGGWSEVARIDVSGGKPLPRVNVSLKLSALSGRWDPCDPEGSSREVCRRLRPILALARTRGAFVNVDMESHAYQELTLRIFREILSEEEFRDWADVGIAIQAYLRSGENDLVALARWAERRGTPVWVRLIKGAYWDYEMAIAAQNGWMPPVYTDKPASDAAFERCTRILLERHAVLRPAFGSHNARSIAYAMAVASDLGIADDGYEFQMLHGMADPLRAAVVGMGRRLRLYLPYGELLPGMAYLVRRLLENTSNTSFVRAGYLDKLPEEMLLMKPAAVTPTDPPCPPSPHPQAQPPFDNEPPADFSREPARAAMRNALIAWRPRGDGDEGRPLVDFPAALRIAGAWKVTDRRIVSHNPSRRSEVVAVAGSASVDDVNAAVAAAKAAFPAWRDRPATERAVIIARVAEELARDRYRLAALITLETGKGWRESDGDVCEAIDFCRYYARIMLHMTSPRRRDLPGEENETVYEARGVTAVIAPWNFPLAILAGMTVAAVVTGNTAIMKPAEQSSGVAYLLMRAFETAGLPPGVVNLLPGVGEEIGPLLVAHPDVSIIVFTGSRQVGLAITRLAAETEGLSEVKRVITEMGGKNAIIVDRDADLDEAVAGVIGSAFAYQGQKCSACSRAIVHAALYDRFLERLIAATASLAMGEAEDPGAAIGPVIDAESKARILARIADGKGTANLVYVGESGDLADRGHYIAPHIFADVPPASRLAQAEIFGPVLAVMKVDGLDQALAIANGTRYALTGGCYSRSPAVLDRVRREFRVGNLYLNRKITGAMVDRQPFGGFKLSGIGSQAGGPDYLLQFVVPRTITENTLRHGLVANREAAPGGE